MENQTNNQNSFIEKTQPQLTVNDKGTNAKGNDQNSIKSNLLFPDIHKRILMFMSCKDHHVKNLALTCKKLRNDINFTFVEKMACFKRTGGSVKCALVFARLIMWTKKSVLRCC